MPGTALWVDGFICLPVSPFICLPLSPRLDAWHGSLGGRVRFPGFTCLPLSPFICLPLSPSLDDPVWVDGFICLPLSFVSRCLPAWMPGTALWVDGFIWVHLSPFVSLHLSPVVSQPGWLGGQIHLSPCVSLHLSPVVSQPGSGTALWVDGFMCLPLSPSFVSRSLPAWMPGTALWVDGFICLPLSPLISPVVSQPAWHGSLGGRVHLSPFVSLHLSPVVSQPGCLARLSGWTGSFVYLCLSGCLAPLHCFVSLHLSPVVSQPGCLALLFCGQIHFSPFVSLHLAPVVSQPGCLSRLSRRTDSLVSLGSLHLSPISVGGRVHLFPFVSLDLSPVVSQPGCLARLSGWTDSFVSRCLPAGCVALSSAVSFTSRGSVLLAGSGLPSALALASVIPCLVDVGDRVLLCLPFIWTSISLGLVAGRLPCLSLATPCLFVQCLVISCGPELTIALRGFSYEKALLTPR